MLRLLYQLLELLLVYLLKLTNELLALALNLTQLLCDIVSARRFFSRRSLVAVVVLGFRLKVVSRLFIMFDSRQRCKVHLHSLFSPRCQSIGAQWVLCTSYRDVFFVFERFSVVCSVEVLVLILVLQLDHQLIKDSLFQHQR